MGTKQSITDLTSIRLAFIGLDGVNPETLMRYICEGRLPTIDRIIKRSREIEIKTEGELFLNSPWPCCASGLSVGFHGIHAFRPIRPGSLRLVEGTEFRMPVPFWEMAARAGVRTCALDVPLYGPPTALACPQQLKYVEWGPHPPLRPPSSMPSDLTPLLLKRHGPHPCTSDVEFLSTLEATEDMVSRLSSGALKRAAVIRDLIQTTDPELFVAVFSEPHTAAHQWLNRETPGHRSYDASMISPLGSPIAYVYEAVDNAIGQVVGQLPPETTILLICLGGFRVTHGGSYFLWDLLERLGFLVCSDGPSPFENAPNLCLDWSKTRALALPWAYDGYLRLNQRGREPDGIVGEGAEREQILAEIESAVRSLRIAGTRKPAARAIVRTQEQFQGSASNELPDLMVLWNNSRPFDAIESDAVGRIENRDPATRCAHSAQGAMFAYGPLIADGPRVLGARDFDIAPTVLALLGLDCPAQVDGRVLREVIASKPLSLTPRQQSSALQAG